jgi:MFS family permease
MKRYGLLFTMLFLQYAILGSWSPTVGKFFIDPSPAGFGLNGAQLGWILAALPLSTILMPPIFGALADRKIAPERLMAGLHLCSAGSLLLLSRQHSTQGVFITMFLHALLYAPTLSLSQSVAFAKIQGTTMPFSYVRLVGSFGWTVAGLSLSAWRSFSSLPVFADSFIMAGFFSFLLATLCFVMPRTAPAKTGRRSFVFLDALELFNKSEYRIFAIFGLLYSIQLEFYYMHTSAFMAAPTLSTLAKVLPTNFLETAGGGLGLSDRQIPALMGISLITEIASMVLLPTIIRRFGLKATLVVGMMILPIRFLIFGYLPFGWISIPALGLHGISFTFVVVAGFILTERLASPDIRSSAQALTTLVVLGIGKLIGTQFAGLTRESYTRMLPAKLSIPSGTQLSTVTDWQTIFLIPGAVGILTTLVFALIFPKNSPKD